MTDYLKIILYTALTVILMCLIRSGHCYPDYFTPYVDYKRDAPITTAIRSAKVFNKADLLDLLDGKVRERSYLTNPVYKRQIGSIGNILPTFEILRRVREQLREEAAELQQQSQIKTNQDIFHEGGKR